ncbi:MAG: winged helix DNA-binding domain-containing protein [Longimicrobiales bacterium]
MSKHSKAREIARLRLQVQGISQPRFETPESVVHWLGAVQSQEYGPAKWSVGQRMHAATDARLERAVAEGTILRTHVPRPTWHFILPADIRWMLELTAPRVRTMLASYDRKLELDDAVYARSNAVIAQAVEGGNHLTRTEIAAVLESAGLTARGQRLGHLVARAELDRVICSGAPRGKQQTYASFDERAPGAPSLDRDEALAELTRRYFTSHGPATVKDFRWWSSLKSADAKRGLDIVGSELERASIDGRDYWFAEPQPATRRVRPRAHLLQGYDEYIVAYTESRHVLNVDGLLGPAPKGAVSYLHACILDGQVIGHWRHRAGTTAVEVRLLKPLDRTARKTLEDATAAYGRFLDVPVTLRLVESA